MFLKKAVAVIAVPVLAITMLAGCTALVDLSTTAEGAKQGAEQVSQTQDIALATELDNTVRTIELAAAETGDYSSLINNGVTILYHPAGGGSGYIVYKTYEDSQRTAYRSSIDPKVVYLDAPATSLEELSKAGLSIPEGMVWS